MGIKGIQGIGNIKQELYFGNDVKINDDLTIHQPTLREIFEFHVDEEQDSFPDGEMGFFRLASVITSTPADYDVALDDAGVRYEDVDELEFFFAMVRLFKLKPAVTHLLFGDLNFENFERNKNDETNAIVYIDTNKDDPKYGMKIDKAIYMQMMNIIRTMLNLPVNRTRWENEASRSMHMDMERKRRKRKHHSKVKSVLIPVLSMLVNDPGFKYNRDQCLDLNINFVYDCLKQRMHYQAVDHLMTGVYVGLIDTKKMNLSEELSFIRKDDDT